MGERHQLDLVRLHRLYNLYQYLPSLSGMSFLDLEDDTEMMLDLSLLNRPLALLSSSSSSESLSLSGTVVSASTSCLEYDCDTSPTWLMRSISINNTYLTVPCTQTHTHTHTHTNTIYIYIYIYLYIYWVHPPSIP